MKRLAAAALFAVCASTSMAQVHHRPCSSSVTQSCYTGRFGLLPNAGDPSGRTRILQYDFGFVDQHRVGWQTNAGDVTNGASIPWWIQWLAGEPYDERFIGAAVVHDRYCDDELRRRVRAWQDTHKMFPDALRASGVSRHRAKVMGYFVYRYGPRWEKVDRPGHPCRGGITPACQQMVTEEWFSKHGTDAADRLVFTQLDDGSIEVYRPALPEPANAKEEAAWAMDKLAPDASPGPGQTEIDADFNHIVEVSRERDSFR